MFLRASLILCLLVGILPSAIVDASAQSRLPEFLAKLSPGDLVSGADRFAAPTGNPPVAAVLAGERTVGYAFVNSDWVNSTGYSGKPIEILVGLSTDGKIAGARLMDHHEPIVLIGIPPERIANFIKGYVGRDVLQIATNAPSARPEVDIVSGATVTVAVIADSMIRSAIRVARTVKVGGVSAAAAAAPAREIDPAHSAPEDWTGMLGDGSVRRLSLSVGEVTDAFRRAGNNEAAANPEAADPAATFIDLYAGLVSVPAIGKRLLGEDGFAALQSSLKPGQQAILVASNGLYSFKGSGYVRGGIFDRFEVIQGDTSIRFRDRTHSRVGGLQVSGAPEFHEADLFRVPEGTTLDPAEPWRLQLLVQRGYGARDKAFLTFNLGYELPQAYLKQLPATAQAASPQNSPVSDLNEPPLWQAMWRAKLDQIVILLVALTILTGVFFFQDWFASRPRLYDRVRLGFLVFTLIWLGWYAQAQLSVVNVLTFLNALRTDFRWDYFLMAPLIFILWFATAASLLFWNRGAFCGWLCPFGALQELLNRAARARRHTAVAHPVRRSSAAGGDQIHHLPGAVRRLAQRARHRRERRRGRAVQDRDHPALRARLAVRPLRRRDPGGELDCGAVLLPLSLSARRRARDPGAAAHVRLAAALPRMRQPVPALRQRMPGAGDPSRRPHQSERMHPVPALPDALSPRPQVPGDDPASTEARETCGHGIGRRWCCLRGRNYPHGGKARRSPHEAQPCPSVPATGRSPRPMRGVSDE